MLKRRRRKIATPLLRVLVKAAAVAASLFPAASAAQQPRPVDERLVESIFHTFIRGNPASLASLPVTPRLRSWLTGGQSPPADGAPWWEWSETYRSWGPILSQTAEGTSGNVTRILVTHANLVIRWQLHTNSEGQISRIRAHPVGERTFTGSHQVQGSLAMQSDWSRFFCFAFDDGDSWLVTCTTRDNDRKFHCTSRYCGPIIQGHPSWDLTTMDVNAGVVHDGFMFRAGPMTCIIDQHSVLCSDLQGREVSLAVRRAR
jgi:hypothetical protein